MKIILNLMMNIDEMKTTQAYEGYCSYCGWSGCAPYGRCGRCGSVVDMW